MASLIYLIVIVSFVQISYAFMNMCDDGENVKDMWKMMSCKKKIGSEEKKLDCMPELASTADEAVANCKENMKKMMECWQKKKAGGGGEGGGGGRRGFKSMTDEQKTAMKAKWEENKKKMEVEKAKMLEDGCMTAEDFKRISNRFRSMRGGRRKGFGS